MSPIIYHRNRNRRPTLLNSGKPLFLLTCHPVAMQKGFPMLRTMSLECFIFSIIIIITECHI